MRNPLAVSAVLAFVFFVACVDHVQHAAALPFLRSLIACDTPPTSPEADGWSGSPKCGKLDLVVRDAQEAVEVGLDLPLAHVRPDGPAHHKVEAPPEDLETAVGREVEERSLLPQPLFTDEPRGAACADI